MKNFEILLELPKCNRHKVSRCYWENDTNKLAQWRVIINLTFVKKKERQKKEYLENTVKQSAVKWGMPVVN